MPLRFCIERKSRKHSRCIPYHSQPLCRGLIDARRGCPQLDTPYLGATSARRFSSLSRRPEAGSWRLMRSPIATLPRTDALKPLGTVDILLPERAAHHRKCAVLQTEENRSLSTNGEIQSRNVLHMHKQTTSSDTSLCGWLNSGHRNKDPGWRG